jgi:glutaredoxin/uncharacterized protein (DUF302 family)
MNIAYVRKTDKSAAEVAEKFKEGIKAQGITLIGEKEISNKKSVLLYFSKPSWIEKIVAEDHTLIGLVPSIALIQEKDGKTMISIGNPQLLMGGPHLDTTESAVEEMDAVLRKIVNEAAGARDPKVEAVKMYSTTTCAYCRMEKEYLEKNKISFDLVMVDADRKAGEEMVRKTGQMGVPVTEVTFDDGESEIIVGFDKSRLNELLKIAA